jgi:hypothetical protein
MLLLQLMVSNSKTLKAISSRARLSDTLSSFGLVQRYTFLIRLEHFQIPRSQLLQGNVVDATTIEATMNVRFVDDQEQDPAVLHRRRLQAKRTQNYRQRKKANQDIKATDDLVRITGHWT